jgi:5-methylcytosine-specific restriction endonuclease McrA
MISERDFNDSTSRKRNDMAKRLKPKKWKSGKRIGRLRKPGRELPFTLAEFRAWCKAKIGFGAVRCHYCPRPIDILHFEPDHFVPLELGGGLGLDNLVPACEVCNRVKGAMPPYDFIALMTFIESNLSAVGRADVVKRLRSGAMGIRLRFESRGDGANQKQKLLPVPEKEMDLF